MVLTQITVRGVKCFRDEVTVGPFGAGLNMIFGPNETGKSTLIEATARALFDDYSSKAESIKQMRPWGTSLAPEITLEFTADEAEYRLTKRLLDDAMCRLQRREAGAWTGLHERDRADAFVRELLHGEDAHGASDLRHWGLAQTLWCLNDPCMIGRGNAACVVPTAVAGQVREVLGEGTVATALEAVRELVEARYDVHFQKQRGNPSKGSPIAVLQEEIEDLEQRRTEATAALEEVEAAADRLEGIEAELRDLEQERGGREEQIAQYREEAERVEAQQREIERLETELKRARSDHDERAGDVERFTEARDAADRARGTLEEVARRLEGVEDHLRTERRLVEDAEEELRDAQDERRGTSREFDRGRKIEQALDLLDERERLVERLAEIEGLAEERRELERRLQEMPRPEDGEIERADTLERKVERLQTQLEAAGLTVTVEAHREQEVALSGGEDELSRTLVEGDEVQYTAGASLMIDLPEVARVSVRSGASEPAELQEALEQTRADLRGLLAEYAADNSAGLRELQRAHDGVAEELGRHDERMQRAAEPFEGPEQVRDRQAEVRLELTKRLNGLEMSEEELTSADRPDLDGLEALVRAAEEREEGLQDTLGERRTRVEALSEQREGLREERSDLDASIRESEATVAGVLERYDREDEEGLRAVLGEARQRVEALEARLPGEREKLPAEEADPRNLIETAKAALEQTGKRRDELREQRGGVRLVIERARTEGRYEQLSAIEERLETARRKLRGTWREAQGVKLLRELLDLRRSEVTGGALPGLEARVAQMLRHITGRDRPLRMSEEMTVTALTDGEIEHDPESLSSGAREQLDLVTRLALGGTYAREAGRVMMVLDDPLLHTDPRRHDRIKQILQREADALQIFILTSHPRRYRGIVPGECQFDLEDLRASAG